MSHIHDIVDTDVHYKIDGVTRTIVNIDETKRSLVQNDHNSERFTFEIPRYVDGHDFSKCNVVQIHYENEDAYKKNKNSDFYTVNDLHVKDYDEETVVLSWLISGNATKYVGTLNFTIRFACVTDGVTDYVWNTTAFEGIEIKSGIYTPSAEVVANNPDTIAYLIEAVAKLKDSSGNGGNIEIPENVETTDNKVESIDENSTDEQYPTAKAVYDFVGSGLGGGITTEQITALDSMFKVTAFTENPTNAYNSFKSAFGIGSDDTNTESVNIALSANTLTFDSEESQTLTATVTPTNVTDEVVWKSSNNAVATVENGIVTPVSDGSCIITATVKNVSAQCNVIVTIENEVITYKVNNYLTNVTNSNNATSANAGQSYTATLTANEGYAIDENSIVISMNATEITDSVYNAETNEISIATVTGDISITASAVVSTDWDFEWDYSQGLMSENGFTLIPTIVGNTQTVNTTEEMQENGLYLAAAQGSQLQVVPTGHETIESGVVEISFIAQECGNHYIKFDMSNGENGCRMTMSKTQWQFGGAWAANKSSNNEYTIRIVFNKNGTHYLYANAGSDVATKQSTVAENVTKTGIILYHGVNMLVKSVKYKWNV